MVRVGLNYPSLRLRIELKKIAFSEICRREEDADVCNSRANED